MTSLLPELEGWIKASGALVAVLMAVLVPVRSWIVEDRRFRAQTLEALAAASRNTVAGISASSTILADRIALTDLGASLNRIAAVLEKILEVGQDHERDRLTHALERFLDQHGSQATDITSRAIPPASNPSARPARPAG